MKNCKNCDGMELYLDEECAVCGRKAIDGPNKSIILTQISMKKKDKKVDTTKRDDLLRAICLYTGDGIAKVLPWVKDYLKDNK